MRLILLCVAAAVACAPATTGTATVDWAAEEYVRLVLALDRHDPDLIDAYTGPPEVRREAEAQFATLDTIVEEAARLADRLPRATGDAGRRTFLLAQLRAIERRARWKRGEPSTIRTEAAALGVPLASYDTARVAALRLALDRALPGRATLPERLAQARRSSAVPRSRLDAVMRGAMEDCRARTRQHSTLPADGADVRYVLEIPWLAYTRYLGAGRSVIDVRRDAAVTEADLRLLACHEAYPGHHTQYVVWDRELRDERGWIEFSVTPLFTPHGITAERAARDAAGLLVPRQARPEIDRLLDALAPFALAAAVARVDEVESRDMTLTRLRDEVLMPDPEGFVAFVRRYRAQAAAYVAPVDETLDWMRYAALLRSPAALVADARQ